MTLFPYYPCKQALLNHYIKNHGLLSDGSDIATRSSRSMACQILTSFNVVKEYAENHNIGLG